MDHILDKYAWGSNSYQRMTGTEDFVTVAELGEGGYSWAEFKAFYSPAARRYFWHGDRGCSCNGWSDDLTSASDFQDGDRAALIRAWEVFAKENDYEITITDYLDGVKTINNFNETSN